MPFLENEERAPSVSEDQYHDTTSPAPDSESMRRYTFPHSAGKPVSVWMIVGLNPGHKLCV